MLVAGVVVLVLAAALGWGVQPRQESDGTFSPGPLMLATQVPSTTGYTPAPASSGALAGKKVLVVMTAGRELTMADGATRFLTGNHPVETYVPLLHLQAAGATFDIATVTPGAPAAVEEWALPRGDAAVMALHAELAAARAQPQPLPEALGDEYAAVFVPGGHGAMVGLPESAQLGRLLVEARDANKPVITLCHGPAALLAAADGAFAGFEAVVFPDTLDKITPYLGYLPGHMPYFLAERLQQRAGLRVVNDGLLGAALLGATHVDRMLITGDSPHAADELGRLAVAALSA